MKYINMPPVEYLRAILDYNETTGELIWQTRPREHFATTPAYLTWNTRFAEKPAGAIPCKDGYRRVAINTILFLAHRLIWKMQTGNDPVEIIDHIDLNRGNNVWSNLREATHSDNHHNMAAQINNTSGCKGVHWDKARNKWKAHLMLNGKIRFIGRFETFDEAVSVYREAALRFHGEFTRE